MNQERIRYPRGHVALDVTITSVGREWRGKTVDLSPYGVKIMLELTSVPLESGTRVELRLPLPGAPPMSLAANVERVDLEDGAALTFLQVTEWQFDRLKEFVDPPLRRDCQELTPDMQPGQPPKAGSELRPGTPPAERELAASPMGVSHSAAGGGSAVPREPVSRGDDRSRDGGGWRSVLARLESVLPEERRVSWAARSGREDELARHQERDTVGQGGDGARGGIRRTPPPPVTVVVPTGDLDMESAPPPASRSPSGPLPSKSKSSRSPGGAVSVLELDDPLR